MSCQARLVLGSVSVMSMTLSESLSFAMVQQRWDLAARGLVADSDALVHVPFLVSYMFLWEGMRTTARFCDQPHSKSKFRSRHIVIVPEAR